MRRGGGRAANRGSRYSQPKSAGPSKIPASSRKVVKMHLASRFAAAATAAFMFATIDSPAQAASGACETADIQVLPSPSAPWKGAPLRVMIIAERPLEGAMSLVAPDGSIATKSSDRHGGAPYFWFAEVAAPAAGTWHATLALEHLPADCGTINREISVSARKPD